MNIIYLCDILVSIERIQRYTLGMSYEDFTENDLVRDAVIRNLMVIGEVVKLIQTQPSAASPGEGRVKCIYTSRL